MPRSRPSRPNALLAIPAVAPASAHLQWFLPAWVGVAIADAALNVYAGELASLPWRSTALGVLLLLASTTPGVAPPAALAGSPTERAVYAALFAALGTPCVVWRCLAPLDLAGQSALRHGASILFVLGMVTLVTVRGRRPVPPPLSAGGQAA